MQDPDRQFGGRRTARRQALKDLGLSGLALNLPALFPAIAGAQTSDWPTKPIRITVPYPAGGVIDMAVRPLGRGMSAEFSQAIIVDNKPGANSNIGAQTVLDAPADGHSWLITSPFLVVNPMIEDGLRWKPADFTPVARFASTPSVICVPANSPYKSLRELVEAGRKSPGLQFGDPGSGSTPTLAVQMLGALTGASFQSVLYKGAVPIVPDLVEGRVPMSSLPLSVALPMMKNGKLRALANVSDRRSAMAPDVATLEELGFPQATVHSWFGMHVRSGTPAALIRRISDSVGKAASQPQYLAALAAGGVDAAYLGVDEFTAFLEKDFARMVPFLKSLRPAAKQEAPSR